MYLLEENPQTATWLLEGFSLGDGSLSPQQGEGITKPVVLKAVIHTFLHCIPPIRLKIIKLSRLFLMIAELQP